MISNLKILNRFVIRGYLRTILSTFLFLFIFATIITTVANLSQYSDKDLSFLQVLKISATEIIFFADILISFALIFATMIFLYRLNKSSELIIIKSSGISVWKYLKPIAALVIIIGVSYTLFIDFGISEVKKYRENLADKYGIRRLFDPNAASLFKKETGLWLRENVEINQEDRISYLHAENVKQKGVTVSLIDIFIFEFDKNKNFIKKFEANEAFLNRGYLELKDARIIRINEKPYLEKSILYPTYLTKEKIQESYRSPETVSFWELPKLIKNFKALGFSAKNHIVHYNKLISYFLFLISMVMLASLFAVKINNRKGSAFVNFALGFFVTFTIFFAREFLSALSIAGKLPVFLGVWALPIVILFISLAALLHIEDG